MHRAEGAKKRLRFTGHSRSVGLTILAPKIWMRLLNFLENFYLTTALSVQYSGYVLSYIILPMKITNRR